MPAGLPFEKIEVLVKAVRLTKTRLKRSEKKANCSLIEKLELTTQTRWCHYLAERPGQLPHKVFKSWLGMEGRAAMVQRQSTLAAQYQQGNAQKAQQLPPRAQGLHGNNTARRNAIRTQAHSALSYSTVVDTGGKCPVCSGDSHQPSRGDQVRNQADGLLRRAHEKEARGARQGHQRSQGLPVLYQLKACVETVSHAAQVPMRKAGRG